MLLRQFSAPVLIASLIAVRPSAYLYLHHWLEQYPHRVSLDPIHFITATLVALLISSGTVFVHAWRAAKAHPIHASYATSNPACSRSYLVTALRSLVKNRLISFINIGGLTVGFACSIFIALFVRDEHALTTDGYEPRTTFTGSKSPSTIRASLPNPHPWPRSRCPRPCCKRFRR